MASEEREGGAISQSRTPNFYGENAHRRVSRLRFKSPRSRLNCDGSCENSSRNKVCQHRRHRTQRGKHRNNHSPNDNTQFADASSSHYLDPETAFRESVFDAMADDEGALFWEGVYGQPIPRIPSEKKGPTGKLEAMTEDEYIAYVRAEMYKKTHQYLMDEKARRDQAKKAREKVAAQVRQAEDELRRFMRDVEESLRRGRERKERSQQSLRWEEKWKDYEKGWEDLSNHRHPGPLQIPWPIWSRTKGEITKKQIEEFFLNAPTSGKPEDAELSKTLKAERVRWHPDKFQQKFGEQKLDDAIMRDVTAVFQIIDQVWTELRCKKD